MSNYSSAQKEPTLYVYLHTAIKPNALQKMLEQKMTNVDVTVFGRVRDFEKQLSNSPPDAVMALQPVLSAQNLSPTLRGVRNEADHVPYVLLSNKTQISSDQLYNLTIGAVDLLGRKQMRSFVASMLKQARPPKVKIVTKVEDLLPLLQFELADILFLSETQAQQIKTQSELNLKLISTDASVGLPAVSCLTPAGQTICNEIEMLDESVVQQIGVEKWMK